MSNEMAMQKAEKEKNEQANQPKLKGEKEFEEDQRTTIQKAREREERGDIKQCNEGKWDFTLDEDDKNQCITLDIPVQKHLSSSLIDVDVHPTFISVVIKSKVLRLVLPIEVKAEQSTAKRSLTSGHLLVTMPKFNPKDKAFVKKQQHDSSSPLLVGNNCGKKGMGMGMGMDNVGSVSNNTKRQSSYSNGKSLQHTLLQDAKRSLVGTVQLKNIVSERFGGIKYEQNEISNTNSNVHNLDMVESSTRSTKKVLSGEVECSSSSSSNGDNDEPPPMF
jgi:hypothetical protein